jgi:hypothetical protein
VRRAVIFVRKECAEIIVWDPDHCGGYISLVRAERCGCGVGFTVHAC